MMQVLKEDGTLGIISKTSKYGVNAASSSCPLLLFFYFIVLSVNRGQRITQQDYSESPSSIYFVYLFIYFDD